MNRTKRFLIALLLGLLLAVQMGPAAAGLPMRCGGNGCRSAPVAVRLPGSSLSILP
ncbi:MAG: hypothetical protein JNM70_20345 [Anaerolineae bacterium]|nr:hypothetical protein [Anaerolineae bacterium]